MPRVTDFTALTFDCYGTLIDWERGVLDELKPWAEAHRLNLSDGALLKAFGETEARCEAATPRARYPQILENVLEALASRWSVTPQPGEAAAFGESVGRWPAFPDSPVSLQYLHRYYRLVILSNVDHASFERSRQKLGGKFDLVITAEDVGAYKPDPRNFEFALAAIQREFQIDRREILHVAQSIFHDIVPAKKAGWTTMWINRRKGLEGWGATPPPQTQGEGARPDFEVASLTELVALHRNLLALAATNRD